MRAQLVSHRVLYSWQWGRVQGPCGSMWVKLLQVDFFLLLLLFIALPVPKMWVLNDKCVTLRNKMQSKCSCGWNSNIYLSPALLRPSLILKGLHLVPIFYSPNRRKSTNMDKNLFLMLWFHVPLWNNCNKLICLLSGENKRIYIMLLMFFQSFMAQVSMRQSAKKGKLEED